MSGSSLCTTSNLDLPVISGLHFQPLQANFVSGYSTALPGLGHWTGHDELDVNDLSFCNVSLTYTQDGHTEPINTQVYLPLGDAWNGRMVGVGGGGWSAGLGEVSKQGMVGGVNDGYVTVGTNGGGDPYNPSPKDWLLKDDGKVNMYLLGTWWSQTLDDAAKIGKALAKSFYGSTPKYSYFQGCSQGGRQGLTLAQNYPDAYDGILSVAPAINIPSFLSSNYWLAFLMDHIGEYPHGCELEAIREAVIAQCDYEDGVGDGIIASPDTCLCFFDPLELVGTPIACAGSKRNVSETAATIAKAAWTGPMMHNGVLMASPYYPDANLINQFGQGRTYCVDDQCSRGDPHHLVTEFLTQMVRKDVDLTKISQFGFEQLYHSAKGQFDHIMATDNPDLSQFRNRGGKIISFHGLSDEIIPPGGTQKYYEAVLEQDPQARNYFRYFDAPGLGHCWGGLGPYPTKSFEDLVAWVERGQTPDTILAKGPPNSEGEVIHRPLCAYPLVARYKGTGNITTPENYYCAEEYLSATPMKIMLERMRKAWATKSKPENEL